MMNKEFWLNDIKIVISISMYSKRVESPESTDNPFLKVNFPQNIPTDTAANTLFAYGCREGIRRLLDLWSLNFNKACIAHASLNFSVV